VVAQCPRNREKEGDVKLSIPETRVRNDAEIKIASKRGDVPEKSGIRIPEPGREKIKIGLTRPERPSSKEVSIPPTREMWERSIDMIDMRI